MTTHFAGQANLRQLKALGRWAAGMSGAPTGTSGGKYDPNGGSLEWQPVVLVAAIALAVGVVNASSWIMEAERSHSALNPLLPWTLELTSAPVIILLAPLVGWMAKVLPPTRDRLIRFTAGHASAATAFCVLHCVGFAPLRMLFISQYQRFYEINLFLIAYEWRKDVITYVMIAAVYWGWRKLRSSRRLEAAPSPTPSHLISVRNGSRTLLIEPRDVLWIEAAGNYVQIHVNGGVSHLVRGAVSSFAEKLSKAGIVRVHRSRLVNRTHIRGLRTMTSGDVEITLDDGTTINGSRRYRAAIGPLGE